MNPKPHYSFATADRVDPPQLDRFLSKVFSKSRNEFLNSYGPWWHRGNQNRWVILNGDEVAAYCGIIPTRCLINGAVESAFWWIDLVIDPKFRGQGIQTIIDRKIRERDGIKLGFPNKLAAKIHLKHGWGVREDLQVLMLPLQPLNVKNVQQAEGVQGSVLRTAAFLATPLAGRIRRRLADYSPITAQPLENPSAEIFDGIFQRHRKDDIATTCRDVEYMEWRYLNAPYRPELSFYIAGKDSSPSHFLIVRHIPFYDILTTRILDIFGDFDDVEGLKDILKLAVRDAILKGSSQITAMVTLPELKSALRSIRFLIGLKSRFCWCGNRETIMGALSRRCHWTLGDSDNDAPE